MRIRRRKNLDVPAPRKVTASLRPKKARPLPATTRLYLEQWRNLSATPLTSLLASIGGNARFLAILTSMGILTTTSPLDPAQSLK
jgi:hypothetical protein